MLILGGVCYIVDLLAAFLIPDVGQTMHGFVVIPSAIAEVSMVLYLLTKGVRSSPQTEVNDSSQLPTVSVPATA